MKISEVKVGDRIILPADDSNLLTFQDEERFLAANDYMIGRAFKQDPGLTAIGWTEKEEKQRGAWTVSFGNQPYNPDYPNIKFGWWINENNVCALAPSIIDKKKFSPEVVQLIDLASSFRIKVVKIRRLSSAKKQFC